jgi:hypothetical protein
MIENKPPAANANQPNYAANPQWNPNPTPNPVAAAAPQMNYAGGAADSPSGRAVASLILTICGLVLCCGGFTAIPGAILGWLEMSAIKEGRSSPKGMIMAQIGLWGGIIVTVIMGGLAVFWLFIMMLGGASGY